MMNGFDYYSRQYMTDRMVKAFCEVSGASIKTTRQSEVAAHLNAMGVRILRADYEGRVGADRYRKVNARDVRFASVGSCFLCSWEIV